MGILTGLLFVILVIGVVQIFLIAKRDYKSISEVRRRLSYIKSVGSFALVTGILGQLVGLYAAFTAIEQAMDVSPAIMMGGLKVSMITTMYGMLIFLISYLLWLAADYIASMRDK